MRNNDINIRLACADDCTQIATLIEKAPWATPTSSNFTHSDIAKKCQQQLSSENNYLVVAEQEGVIIGYATLHIFPAVYMPVDEAMISDLFVVEDYTSEGVGSLLLKYLENIANEHGAIVALYQNNTRLHSKADFYDRHNWQNAKHLDVYVKKFGKVAEGLDF